MVPPIVGVPGEGHGYRGQAGGRETSGEDPGEDVTEQPPKLRFLLTSERKLKSVTVFDLCLIFEVFPNDLSLLYFKIDHPSCLFRAGNRR